MNVLQVLNYSSSDGRYGGPQKVAESLSRGLLASGVSSKILALTNQNPGVDGVSVLFRARKLMGMDVIPLMYSASAIFWLRKNIRNFDVAHIHLSRDLFTNAIGLYCLSRSKPFVVQTHGMLLGERSLLKKLWDRLIVRRLLASAKQIFYLTEEEKKGLQQNFHLDSEKLIKLVNGSSLVPGSATFSGLAKRKVVLYASRLDPRKRPLTFIEMAELASNEFPHLEFQIAGADSGSLHEVLAAIKELGNPRVEYLGSLTSDEIQSKLDESICVVLPALWDVFPMIMVEAACRSVPVIAVGGYETSDWFAKNGAAELSNGDGEDLVRCLRLIASRLDGYQSSTAQFAQEHLDEKAVAKKLEKCYHAILVEVSQ